MAENNTTASLLNTTAVKIDSTDIGIVYLVTSLLVMFSNSIVMIVVVSSRELHLPTLWNIAFMALCDFSYGLHYLVFAVPSAFLKRFAYPESLVPVSSCILTLLFGQNVLNIAVVTVDRYLSVCWPLKYPQLMTAKRFIIAIVITVVINVCRLCLIVVPKGDVYYNSDFAITLSKFETLLSAVFSVGFPFLTVIVIIGLLLRMMCEIASVHHRVHQSQMEPLARQFTITICLSAGVFCLAYIPICINIIWSFMIGRANVPLASVKFGLFCLLSNSLWNVAIYACAYRPFRDAFLRLFCKDYYGKKRQMEIYAMSVNATAHA